MNPWETYVRKDGRKDVRVRGASPGAMYLPRQYKAAKREAVAREIAARDLAAAEKQAVQIQRELSAMAKPAGVSAVELAKAAVQRVLDPGNSGKHEKP